jgi:cation transport ATPase
MGFAETGASRLRNNRNLLGERSEINDAHLKIGKSKKKKRPKSKMSAEEYEQFKTELKDKKRSENRKLILSLVFLVLLAILAAAVFLIL